MVVLDIGCTTETLRTGRRLTTELYKGNTRRKYQLQTDTYLNLFEKEWEGIVYTNNLKNNEVQLSAKKRQLTQGSSGDMLIIPFYPCSCVWKLFFVSRAPAQPVSPMREYMVSSFAVVKVVRFHVELLFLLQGKHYYQTQYGRLAFRWHLKSYLHG